MENVLWDFNTLKARFRHEIPMLFREETGCELPFPPSLIEDLTVADVKFLKRVRMLDGDEVFRHWSDLYWEVNMITHEDCLAYESQDGDCPENELPLDPERILSDLQQSPSTVPVAPLFLLLADLYRLEAIKETGIEIRRGASEHSAETQKRMENLLCAVETLQKIREGEPVDSFSQIIARTMKKLHIDLQLEILAETIKVAGAATVREYDNSDLPDTLSRSHRSDKFFEGFEGLLEHIKANGCTKFVVEARRLLIGWGIEMGDDYRQRRRRR